MFPGILAKLRKTTSEFSFSDHLLSWPDDIPVTADKGPLEQSKAIQKNVAIYKDGRVLISSKHENKPAILNLLHKAERYGLELQQSVAVDPEEIRIVYQGTQNSFLSEKDSSRMRSLLFRILEEAAEQNASDIQIRIDEDETTITCRKNGRIQQLKENIVSDAGMSFATAIFNACDARSSGTNHQEESFQSGAISGQETDFKLPKLLNSCRLQFNPISGRGRDIAIRLFYNPKTDEASDLKSLGYSQKEIDCFNRAQSKPFGLIAITGTTGSGKSTALQRLLNSLNIKTQRTKRIITVEDPVEYPMPGIIQMPVRDNPENRGAAFNSSIRAMLRSDPDVIMISELRDVESASMAFQAVMTGHPTYTTLHVTRAIDIATRLIEDFSISKNKVTNHRNISLLVAQMLVNVLCEKCKMPLSTTTIESSALIERLSHIEEDHSNVCIRNTSGCFSCNYQGISDRTVVAEFIEPDEIFMTFIRENQLEKARNYWLTKLNGQTIEEKMIAKVLMGLVDPKDAEMNIGPFSSSMLNTENPVLTSNVIKINDPVLAEERE